MTYYKPPKPDYDEYSTQKLLALPIIILGLSIAVLLAWNIMFGVPVDLGLTFTGGTEVRLSVDNSIENPTEQINEMFGDRYETITTIPGSGDYIVVFSEGESTPDEIENKISNNDGFEVTELSQVSPSLGGDSQRLALMGMGVAFLLMSLFVVLLFRSLIPAVVILLSAISNILVAGALMNIFGIQLTLGTVGALLMLIGYSVDSDILLNKNVLKSRRESFNNRVYQAMRTGVTMTITSLSAMIVMTILAAIFGIGLLRDMGFVLSIGLGMDLINTYMMNVSILRWYTNKGDQT